MATKRSSSAELLEGNDAPGIIACSVSCAAVAVVCAVVRLYSRLALGKRFELNDWLFIVAMACFVPFVAVFGVTAMFATEHRQVGSTRTLALLTLVDENLYLGTMFMVKLSILAAYDLMVTSRNFRRCFYVVGLFTLMWFKAALIVTNIQCKPLRKVWGEHAEGGWCIAQKPFNLAMTGASIVGSLAILGLALPIVLRLKLSDRKKRLVMLAFGLGAITCAVGIIRFVYTMSNPVKSPDGAMLFSFSVISTVELTLGLLCASMPAYTYFFPGFDRPSVNGVNLNDMPGTGIRHLRPTRHEADISVKITGGVTRGPRRSGIVVMDEVGMTRHENVNGAWRRVLDDDDDDERTLMPSKSYEAGHRYKRSCSTLGQ